MKFKNYFVKATAAKLNDVLIKHSEEGAELVNVLYRNYKNGFYVLFFKKQIDNIANKPCNVDENELQKIVNKAIDKYSKNVKYRNFDVPIGNKPPGTKTCQSNKQIFPNQFDNNLS